MKKIVVLSGAGVSAESGLQTFRDSDGLWNEYRVEEVASIEGWHRNKALVLEFYNMRRRELEKVMPNDAHKTIASLEKDFNVCVVTQNVDNLHERAGSSHVIHLHGELRFGEAVPMLESAAREVSKADILIIIGTSLNVYPAAGLVHYTKAECKIYLIDPKPMPLSLPNFTQIEEKATSGMKKLAAILQKES